LAIAAHPNAPTNDYDEAALARLDGAEVCHPVGYFLPDAQREFAEFQTRGRLAAIGSSDFHGLGPMGACRTYVFARDATEAGILDAIRARRTVVYAASGVYGDPELVTLAKADGRFGESLPAVTRTAPQWVSGGLAVIGLAVLLARRPGQRAAA
jgi:hypothetical protein